MDLTPDPDPFAGLPPALRPTDAELAMGLEAAGVNPPQTADQLERRIEFLEEQRAGIVREKTGTPALLAGIDADIAAAHARLQKLRAGQN